LEKAAALFESAPNLKTEIFCCDVGRADTPRGNKAVMVKIEVIYIVVAYNYTSGWCLILDN